MSLFRSPQSKETYVKQYVIQYVMCETENACACVCACAGGGDGGFMFILNRNIVKNV